MTAWYQDVRRELPAGLLSGFLAVAFALSSAALIFPGALAPWLPYGLIGCLLGTAIVTLALGRFGSVPFALAGPDSISSAIIGVMSVGVYHDVARHNPALAAPTAIFGIALTTFAVALWLFIVGRTRSARWVRLIPHPVIGGFIATSGFLVTTGSFRVATGVPLSYDRLADFGGADVWPRLAAFLIFAAAFIIVPRRLKSPLALPGMILVAACLVHTGLAVAHVSLARAGELGWLFIAPNHALPWFPFTRDHLTIDAAALVPHLGTIVAIIVVVTINIAIGQASIEMESDREVDLDRDMRITGAADAIAGAIGAGYISYTVFIRTMLNYRLGARSALSGIIVSGLCVFLALGPIWLLTLIPKVAIAGVLLSIGLPMLNQWLVQTWRSFAWHECFTIVAILAINMQFGFQYGLIAGLIISCATFAMSYANIDVIRTRLSGSDLHSSLQRSPVDAALLDASGEAILIFCLQGYLFFGMADRLYRTVRAEALELAVKPKFVVIDFRLVSGIDASAVTSLIKLQRATLRAGVKLIFTGMAGTTRARWHQGVAANATAATIPAFDALDAALETCEDELLAGIAHEATRRAAGRMVKRSARGRGQGRTDAALPAAARAPPRRRLVPARRSGRRDVLHRARTRRHLLGNPRTWRDPVAQFGRPDDAR